MGDARERQERLEWRLEESRDENELLADRVAELEAALRPFAENWDLNAAPHLVGGLDGEEARVFTARTVAEMLDAILAARDALAGSAPAHKEPA